MEKIKQRRVKHKFFFCFWLLFPCPKGNISHRWTERFCRRQAISPILPSGHQPQPKRFYTERLLLLLKSRIQWNVCIRLYSSSLLFTIDFSSFGGWLSVVSHSPSFFPLLLNTGFSLLHSVLELSAQPCSRPSQECFGFPSCSFWQQHLQWTPFPALQVWPGVHGYCIILLVLRSDTLQKNDSQPVTLQDVPSSSCEVAFDQKFKFLLVFQGDMWHF